MLYLVSIDHGFANFYFHNTPFEETKKEIAPQIKFLEKPYFDSPYYFSLLIMNSIVYSVSF